MLDHYRYGSNCSVSAHGKAATRLDKQYADVRIIPRWRIQNAAAHHIMTPRLEHEAGANPIEFTEKMLTPFAHVRTVQSRSATRDYANGVAAGVGVDAEE